MTWRAISAGPYVVVAPVNVPAAEGAFPGLYMSSPPPACPWVGGGGLLLQTTWGAGEAIVHVDVGTGDVTRLTPPPAANEGTWAGAAPAGAAREGGGGSWTLLDVCDGVVAAASSTPMSPPRVHVAWVGDGGGGGGGGGVGGGGGGLSPALLGPGRWVPVQSDYRGAAAAPALRAIEGLEYHVTTVLREGDGEVEVGRCTSNLC